jgi:nucleoside-diphosphate-sugar epimerase
VRRGDEVTALVRSPAKAALLHSLGVQLVPGDLHDQAALQRAVGNADVVYHVAGLTAARDEAEFLRANRDGTANLLAAAAGGAARFVLVSSMAAGGPSAPGHPSIGDEAPRPVTAYGRSKLAGEMAVRASTRPWTIVRPPMVYGPRDTEVLKVFKLARGGIVPLFGEGTQELSAISGPDLAAALVAAGTSPACAGRIYYACHPEIFSSEEFVLRVGASLGRRVRTIHLPLALARIALGITGTAARLAGKATILTADKANEFFQTAWTGSPDALQRDSGWHAAQSLTEGLRETADWYRTHGWL